MQKPVSKWVQREAAKHITPERIRQRIAHEEKQINALAAAGPGQEIEQAREAHFELIQVLTERLADIHERTSRTANKPR